MEINQYSQEQIEYFVNGYVAAALFVGNDEYSDPLDANFSGGDINCDDFEEIKSDCISFMDQARHLMDSGDLEQMGTDFFFVRHGHGAGFSDREWISKEDCEKLTNLANKFKETYWFVMSNGEIGVE